MGQISSTGSAGVRCRFGGGQKFSAIIPCLSGMKSQRGNLAAVETQLAADYPLATCWLTAMT